MSNRRSLRSIRREAPEVDRNSRALTPSRPLHTIGMNSGHVKAEFRARTPEALEAWCRNTAAGLGPHMTNYGAAAVAISKWGAVTVWLMWSPDGLTNPVPVAITAAQLCEQDDRARLGYPSLSRNPFSSILARMSPEIQREARTLAAATMLDWERAGQPHLVPAIERTQKYIHAVMFRESNAAMQENAA